VALVLGALGAFGGGGGSDDPTIIEAGQLNIKLPEGYKIVSGKISAPATKPTSSSGTSSGGPTVTTTAGTTIPLDQKVDPTQQMFTALGKFRKCLDDTGIKFIGAPNAADPNSPTNDPNYIKGLSTCAARSNIVQALQDSQAANQNLSPAEIQLRNKGYLKWRTCMIGRGWKIAKPTPDSQGRLFSFGGSSGGSSTQNQIQAPAGKDLLSSKDLEQCAAKAQKATKQ
jgi:hypothetical protein